MTAGGRPVVRPGDFITFEGAEYHVVGFSGTSVRLRSVFRGESVVLLAHLLAAADFVVVDGAVMPPIKPFGMLEGLPEPVVERARFWERHLIEVITGLPGDCAGPGAGARPQYDPQSTTLAQRYAAKARELSAAGAQVSARTVKRQRARYLDQGL
jgi:putative transposase